MKYLEQLTTKDIKEITKLCVEGDKTYHHHHDPIGTYAPFSMLVVMKDESEFYIYDFRLGNGYKTDTNNVEYVKYMCNKFGEEYINDYSNDAYDSSIKAAEEKLTSLKIKKQNTIEELNRLKGEFKMFVLISIKIYDYEVEEYYTGKTYKKDYQTYPITTSNIEEAKIYKSAKVAINSCEKLNNKLWNWTFKVEKVEG